MMPRRIMNIEQDYFHWLCELVHIDQEDTSWWLVAKDLHRKIFYPIIDRDENRALDGLELRERFLEDEWYMDRECIEGECSVLEMLVALAQRMDFETGNAYETNGNEDRTAYWFWEMMENLGLIHFDDESYVELDGQTYVDDIIDEFVERKYEYNGRGGLFPLRYADRDQRDVEIWYQMSSYLYEHDEIGRRA